MPKKKGAGHRPQEFNGENGRYVKNGGSTAESLVSKYSDNPERDKQAMRDSGQLTPKVSKPKHAYGFANKKLKNSPDHIQHAKEMGFKNQDEYEEAAINFWDSGQGEEYYGSKRGRFAKYNENTSEYVVIEKDGTLKTYYYLPKKQFEKKIKQEEYREWKK